MSDKEVTDFSDDDDISDPNFSPTVGRKDKGDDPLDDDPSTSKKRRIARPVENQSEKSQLVEEAPLLFQKYFTLVEKVSVRVSLMQNNRPLHYRGKANTFPLQYCIVASPIGLKFSVLVKDEMR